MHRIGEEVDLLEGGVDIGRHPDAGEVLVGDRDGEDLVFGKQVIAELGRLDPIDVDQRDPA